jgi:hypothetical protein
MKPRYMIRIEVAEIDEEGYERDTFAEYTTALAIEDGVEAGWIAFVALDDIAIKFDERTDSSPVTPKEATNE